MNDTIKRSKHKAIAEITLESLRMIRAGEYLNTCVHVYACRFLLFGWTAPPFSSQMGSRSELGIVAVAE